MGIHMIARRIGVERWQAVLAAPETAWTVVGEPDLDLDKAWSGLDYLLDDAVPEEARAAIRGGVPIGEDQGYGPVRGLDPPMAAAVAAALDATSLDALRSRYEPEVMESLDVYPGGWQGDDFDGWLSQRFADVCAFYRSAAAEGEAALLTLT
ncbi:MAG TPA: DUF1877 family protein [Actinoplanes sp.]|nr:DUF1877 family protein [Actinoplanes sp.]